MGQITGCYLQRMGILIFYQIVCLEFDFKFQIYLDKLEVL